MDGDGLLSAPTLPRVPMDRRIRERRRKVVQDRARRRRRVTLSVMGALAVVGLAVALSHSPLFAVAAVDVRGVSQERAAEARAAAGVQPGQRLLGVDLDQVEARVGGLTWVRSVEARRSPPSTIELDLVAREPFAVVQTSTEAWVVDAEGVVLAGGVDPALVVVDAPVAVIPAAGGEVADAGVRNALAVHAGLPGPLRAAVDRYDAPSDRGLRFHLDLGEGAATESVWVRFGTAERAEAKTRVLGLLLEQLQSLAEREGQTPQVVEVDVRAPDNPVLVPRP